jgi:8-oxo-dGTP diphosphatase
MVNFPRIGVASIIVKDNKVLMGRRLNAHGSGSWSFPGGHLEFMESVEDCARRETLEETGVEITNIRDFAFTNDFFPEDNKHYVTLFVLADHLSGTPQILEPDKCGGWEWVEWDNLPSPLFLPIDNLLKKSLNPFFVKETFK